MKGYPYIPMGFALSPLLAEVYMSNFENEVPINFKYETEIQKWIRYIDDVLIIWKGYNEDLNAFTGEHDRN